MKKIYDFSKTTKTIQKVSDAIIKENIIKNTNYIDFTTKNKSLFLDKYFNYCNYKASFIKKSFCFNAFVRFFNLYKKNNINLDFNAIQSKIKFLENEKNTKLINCSFKNNTIDSLYNLFLELKNDR